MEITPQMILFGILAILSVATAIGVVAIGNPVRAALCLVLNFFVLALMYFSLNAELLGIVQILVYTGAIMVLFLFTIMMLHLGGPQALTETRDLKRLFGSVFGVALFLLVFAQVLVPMQNVTVTEAPAGFGQPEAMGRALFTTYSWPFLITSILLLIGVVGSILLAKRRI